MSDLTPTPSTIIDGRYRVLDRVGSGGMADVLCAEDLQLGRQVAIKLLHRRFAEDPDFVERFRREASAAAGLQHPNVVSIYDRGEWDGTSYIVMEYLDGRTLKEIIRERAPLDPALAIELTLQILRAARFAHTRGIIHRDLKPQNVIVTEDDPPRAKVTDFGIAKAGAPDMTETGSIMGTAQYLSPEQAQGHQVTAASDLYSIGVILYEMLTGRVPFDGETAVTVALKHVAEEPEPPHRFNPSISPELEAVVLRAMEKDAHRRFQAADEFCAALEAARGGGGAPSAPLSLPHPVLPPSEPFVAIPPAAPYAPELLEAYPPAPLEDRAPGEDHTARWWLVLLAALVVAGAILAAVLLSGKEKVRVPGVIGQPRAEAEMVIKARGLSPDVTPTESRTVPAGRVMSQSPAPGARIVKGEVVRLAVSSGPGIVRVPILANVARSKALAQLRKLGLKVQEETRADDIIKENRVISSSPAAGQELERGATVQIVVSAGRAPVDVPKVTGSSEEDARSTLEALGLTVKTTDKETASAEPGTVLTQSPAAHQDVPKGATVNLVVAKEPAEVDVPSVVDQNESDAVATLSDAGFRIRTRQQQVDDQDQDGQVLSQTPSSGRVRKGAPVTITVGRYVAAPPTTPQTTTPAQTTTTPAPPATTTTPAP